ncbi:MAG: hypothetical protein ABFD97_06530 [Syntrophobacter sp.]
MALILPTKEPKWYKPIFKSRGIKLWQLCRVFDVAEPVMCRWMNGIEKMPDYVDQGMTVLANLLESDELEEHSSSGGEAV